MIILELHKTNVNNLKPGVLQKVQITRFQINNFSETRNISVSIILV